MRRFVAFMLVVVVGATAAVAAARQPAPTITRVPVSGPISVLMGPGGNVGVVAEPDGVVLIDAMEPAHAATFAPRSGPCPAARTCGRSSTRTGTPTTWAAT